MSTPEDTTFFQRSDAFIGLANDQMKTMPGPRVVTAMSFATAHFNTWLCAGMFGDVETFKARKAETIAEITKHYREMLEENWDNYAANFDSYITPANKG